MASSCRTMAGRSASASSDAIPGALDWMIIQNTNAYESGFTPAWDGFRKAFWVNRSAESEAPLAAF